MNRKLAELRKNGNDDQNSGPLENKLSNLKKQAEELKAEFLNVQKQWITNQAKLIDEQSSKMKISRFPGVFVVLVIAQSAETQ